MKGDARKTQYRLIYQHRGKYEVKAMCKFFSISRASYYAWIERSNKPDKDAEHMQLVQDAWEKSRKTYGYRRVTLWLQQKKGLSINNKDEVIAGTLPQWKASFGISKKKPCANSQYQPSSKPKRSLTIMFSFTTMKGYN